MKKTYNQLKKLFNHLTESPNDFFLVIGYWLVYSAILVGLSLTIQQAYFKENNVAWHSIAIHLQVFCLVSIFLASFLASINATHKYSEVIYEEDSRKDIISRFCLMSFFVFAFLIFPLAQIIHTLGLGS